MVLKFDLGFSDEVVWKYGGYSDERVLKRGGWGSYWDDFYWIILRIIKYIFGFIE